MSSYAWATPYLTNMTQIWARIPGEDQVELTQVYVMLEAVRRPRPRGPAPAAGMQPRR